MTTRRLAATVLFLVCSLAYAEDSPAPDSRYDIKKVDGWRLKLDKNTGETWVEDDGKLSGNPRQNADGKYFIPSWVSFRKGDGGDSPHYTIKANGILIDETSGKRWKLKVARDNDHLPLLSWEPAD